MSRERISDAEFNKLMNLLREERERDGDLDLDFVKTLDKMYPPSWEFILCNDMDTIETYLLDAAQGEPELSALFFNMLSGQCQDRWRYLARSMPYMTKGVLKLRLGDDWEDPWDKFPESFCVAALSYLEAIYSKWYPITYGEEFNPETMSVPDVTRRIISDNTWDLDLFLALEIPPTE